MSNMRKLWPSEDALLRDHLLRLEPADRHARFCGHLRDESIVGFVRGLDWPRTLVLAQVDRGVARAAAMLVGGGLAGALAGGLSGAGQVELALSVERGWQGRGLGLELTRRVLALARNRGVAELSVLCLPDNVRMQRIVRRLSGELAFGHLEVDAQIRLAWPNAFTLWQEAAIESEAWCARLRAQLGGGPALCPAV
jgi:RimJ/RimL family protein N-acetyltransferase